MAQPLIKTQSKDHRTRKNGHAAEQFAVSRKANNATRGKQIWVGGSIKQGGHWARAGVDYDSFL